MEFFWIILVVWLIWYALFSEDDITISDNKNSPSNNKKNCIDIELIDDEPKKEKKVINNYYVQNNIYVNNSSKKKEGHTYFKWKELGYQVKKGEVYTYKLYGHEVYTEDQVYKISSRKSISYKSKKKYTKSRADELHTYDEWLDLGYQVRKGERKVSGSGANSKFSRDQVAIL
jgi:hypothetical protein